MKECRLKKFRNMRTWLVSVLALSLAACGATPQPNVPTQGGLTEPDAPAPHLTEAAAFEVQGRIAEEWLPLLQARSGKYLAIEFPDAPIEVPAPPPVCQRYAKRAAKLRGSGSSRAAECKDRGAARELLLAALEKGDAELVDAELAAIEVCPGLPTGVVRALRAELAPAACADVIVAPMLESPPPGMPGPVYHALFGLALSGRFERAVMSPPTLSPPYTKARVSKFQKGKMFGWVAQQSKAIAEMSRAGVKLPYYAKGIVAIAAGLAEMRLVKTVRDIPIPDEFKDDQELENVYFAALDEALAPNKRRGRDAALVGLRELAHIGGLRDRRVKAARELLSTLYGGRRIDALDTLMLPSSPAPAPTGTVQGLARHLPPFYAGFVLDPEEAVQPDVLRQLVHQGLSVPHRAALKDVARDPAHIDPLVRFRVELGRQYWRSVDFDQAVSLAASWPSDVARPDDVTLLFASAIALRGGPEDAPKLMLQAPGPLSGIGRVTALDYVAERAGPHAGKAAFNAAYILHISMPQDAGSTRFLALAKRFESAASTLEDPAAQKRASEFADAAEATGNALALPTPSK